MQTMLCCLGIFYKKSPSKHVPSGKPLSNDIGNLRLVAAIDTQSSIGGLSGVERQELGDTAH